MTTAVGADYLDEEKLRDPAPYFSHLREEDPVHWSAFLRSWVVTRYDDVWNLLRANDDLSVDTVSPARASLSPDVAAERQLTYDTLATWLPFIDGQLHGRLRATIRRSFTARRVEELRPRIEAIAASVLDDLAGRHEFDAVTEYSGRLTVEMITSLLGVPPVDVPSLMPAVHGIQLLVHSALGVQSRHREAEAGFRMLVPYFETLTAERMAHPQDDLITAMAVTENRDAAMSVQQIAATCILLIFAGQETTTSLVSSSLLALLSHPEQLALLREDQGLVPAAVEEALRYWGIAWSVTRTAMNDITLHGRTIRRGERITLVLGAANRDPRNFVRPDEFDIRRSKLPHLAFGASIHFCLGAHLGRLEDQIALKAIVERFPNLRLDLTREVRWRPQLITRELEALYLRT